MPAAQSMRGDASVASTGRRPPVLIRFAGPVPTTAGMPHPTPVAVDRARSGSWSRGDQRHTNRRHYSAVPMGDDAMFRSRHIDQELKVAYSA